MNTDIQVFNLDNQGFRPEQEEMLKEPLQASAIKERKGFGSMMLKYIKADTAIDTANRIFGYGRWGYRVVGREHLTIDDEKKGKIEYYTADIELSVAGAAFPFPGDGMGIVTAPFTIEMHEKARKEATSDALKRALRHYGDQFGLCLYNEDDFVDMGDGTLAKVKDVHPAPAQNKPKEKVVDSQPPDPTIKAANPGLYEAALKQKQRALNLNLISDNQGWLDMLKSLGITEFAKGSDIALINGKLTELEKRKAS
jgi:Rad52/22 family double-strand break repair protein